MSTEDLIKMEVATKVIALCKAHNLSVCQVGFRQDFSINGKKIVDRFIEVSIHYVEEGNENVLSETLFKSSASKYNIEALLAEFKKQLKAKFPKANTLKKVESEVLGD
jgi:hypothetical protein